MIVIWFVNGNRWLPFENKYLKRFVEADVFKRKWIKTGKTALPSFLGR